MYFFNRIYSCFADKNVLHICFQFLTERPYNDFVCFEESQRTKCRTFDTSAQTWKLCLYDICSNLVSLSKDFFLLLLLLATSEIYKTFLSNWDRKLLEIRYYYNYFWVRSEIGPTALISLPNFRWTIGQKLDRTRWVWFAEMLQHRTHVQHILNLLWYDLWFKIIRPFNHVELPWTMFYMIP